MMTMTMMLSISPAPNHLHSHFNPKPKNPTRTHSSPLRHQVSLPVPDPDPKKEVGEDILSPSSAAALAAAIRRASPSSPVRFSRRTEKQGTPGLVLPSPDFQRICVEQLDLFRTAVHRDAVISVFVRPAGSYVMNQLELRRVAFYPGCESADCIILVGDFVVPAGLRAAEVALSKQQVEFVSEYGAVVLPLVKHPFVVGFMVAELPKTDTEIFENVTNGEQTPPLCSTKKDGSPWLPSYSDKKEWEIQAYGEDPDRNYAQFTIEQKSIAIMISSSLALAYVMDQKAILLQQSSWQNNVRMSHLVEQIRGSLSSIRALSKMLSVHVKRSEISNDIIEDIIEQGEHMKDTLQQLQDAVFITKANIVQYNEDTLRRMHDSTHNDQGSSKSVLSDQHLGRPEMDSAQKMNAFLPLSSERKDIEMPMPPFMLSPLLKHSIRPCILSNVLKDLVGAAVPLATKQQRFLHFSEVTQQLHVAVEESAIRQALSNLIEGALLRTQIGGRVEVCATAAPAGGALVVIDDNGPDMHYMTQMHSLMPFGANLFSNGQVEDNMTWNFVAGLAVAREVLEDYGCVVHVISPRDPDADLGSRGTRVELWLPSTGSDSMYPDAEDA